MLHDMLKQNAQRIATAAKEEIAEALSKGKDVYFQDPHEEGSVLKQRPDGRIEKVHSRKDFAA